MHLLFPGIGGHQMDRDSPHTEGLKFLHEGCGSKIQIAPSHQ